MIPHHPADARRFPAGWLSPIAFEHQYYLDPGECIVRIYVLYCELNRKRCPRGLAGHRRQRSAFNEARRCTAMLMQQIDGFGRQRSQCFFPLRDAMDAYAITYSKSVDCHRFRRFPVVNIDERIGETKEWKTPDLRSAAELHSPQIYAPESQTAQSPRYERSS